MPKLYGTPGTRALSPTVCTSQSLAECSLGAQLLFDRLIVQSDDQGRQEADPHIIKAHCFPYVPEATPRRIAVWMDELVRGGMVTLYRDGVVGVAQLNGWWTHQPKPRRAYPSRWPAPDGWTDRVFGVPDDAQQDDGGVPPSRGKVPTQVPQSAGKVPATRGESSAPSVSVSVSGSLSVSDAVPRERRNGSDPDVLELQVLAEELTQHPYAMQNVHSGLGAKAVEVMRKHGRAAVETEWRRIADDEGGLPTLRQLVLGADDALNPLRGSRRESPAERKQRERDDYVARTKAEMAAAKAAQA